MEIWHDCNPWCCSYTAPAHRALPHPRPSSHRHCGSISFLLPCQLTSREKKQIPRAMTLLPLYSRLPSTPIAVREQPLLPTLPPAALGNSPGFPQSAHKEFSALLHTSFRAFMLRSCPPAITLSLQAGQGRARPGGQPAPSAPAGQPEGEGATGETAALAESGESRRSGQVNGRSVEALTAHLSRLSAGRGEEAEVQAGCG